MTKREVPILMLLKVDCLLNAFGKQPFILLSNLGRKWTLSWWWWWWWWSILTWTWACLFSDNVFKNLNVGFEYAPTRLELAYYFIWNKASASGGPDPYHISHFSKIKQFPNIKHSILNFSWMCSMHGLEPCTLSFVSNVCLKYAPTWMVSSLIFQKLPREGLTKLPPQNSSPNFFRVSPSVRVSLSIIFSGALRFRPRPSPSILGVSPLDSDSTLNFRLENLVWPPK